ncbi:MAG: hypothetical protein U1D67_08720 [Dehalococcoidia bacterium]|nr:hypothetical protein [Dehalococcoidia bacterium]MDZ4247186.1 hypothetical protein [Dehalococcoidia bacterium]
MAKIESGDGRLLSVDTEKSILRFQEILTIAFEGQPPAKEWEHPFKLEWEEKKFFGLVGKRVEYVLSDGVVVDLNLRA